MSLQLQTGSSFYDMQLNGQRTNVAATLKTGHNIVRIDYLWWGFIFFPVLVSVGCVAVETSCCFCVCRNSLLVLLEC